MAIPIGFLGFSVAAVDFRFSHHFMERDLPSKGSVGDYGLTALVDLDRMAIGFCLRRAALETFAALLV